MSEACCCAAGTTIGPLGQEQLIHVKCLSAALDLGHCDQDVRRCLCRQGVGK